MFGATVAMMWTIVFQNTGVRYYLSNEEHENYAKITWTKRVEKCRRFASEDDANKWLISLREIRNNKKHRARAAKII